MRKMNLTQLHGNGDMIANEDFKKQLLSVLTLMKEGDFSARLPSDLTGLDGKVADTLNSVATHMERFGEGLTRLRNEVGRKGKVGERLPMGDAVGGWAERIEAINSLVDDLSQPTVEMGRVIGAVAKGDLTQTVPLEAGGRPLQGEYLRTAKLVNGMVEQLADFSVEVIRVAREVGTEGKLGGQAQVRNVSGVWRELTESVNQMAGNLTAQVRNIAEVTIAVANGDLSKKITVDVRGEILQLKEAINVMVDQLRSFAAEVTRVAREVGTEGKLGGQAAVPGVAGTWKDLTDNVNSMASNLTAQVRNIAASDDRCGARRSFAQNHGGRERRNSGTQGHHQHHGGSVQRFCLRSDARRARSRHGRKTRRPGRSARRRRNLERSDRQREFHGEQSDRTSSQHRRSDDRRRERRSLAQNHGGRAGRNS